MRHESFYIIITSIISFLSALPSASLFSQTSSQNYVQSVGTIDQAGGIVSSSNFTTVLAVGQSSTGKSQSSNYQNNAGLLNDISKPTENPVLSGYVKRESGRGIPNVRIVFSNNGGSVLTDDKGYYQQVVPYNWSGIVTLEYDTYNFIPSSKSYTSVRSNVTQDYITPIWIVSDVWEKLSSNPGDILNRQVILDLIPIRNEFWNEGAFNKIYNVADEINTVYQLAEVVIAAGTGGVAFVCEFAVGAILNEVLNSFRCQFYYGISTDEWAFPLIVGSITPDPAPKLGYPYRITGTIHQENVTNTIFYRLDISADGFNELNPKQVSEQYSSEYHIPSDFSFKSTAELASASLIEIANKNIFTIGIVNERWKDDSGTYLSLLEYGSNKLNPIVVKIPSLSSKTPPMLGALISTYGKIIDTSLHPINANIYYYLDISTGDFTVIRGAQKYFTGHEVMFEDAIIAVGACPIDIHAYDEQGRHTGALYSGNAYVGVETNIPNSYYIYGATNSAPEAILIRKPNSSSFNIKIIGRGTGSYDSNVSVINSGGETVKQSITQSQSINTGQTSQQSVQIGYNVTGNITSVTFPSTISGRVTLQDGNTNTPLSNLQIQAITGNIIIATTLSNYNGEYVLQVPAGTYQVKVNALTLGTQTINNVKVVGSMETSGINFVFYSSEPQSVSIGISQGWNMVSFPLSMSTSSVADILSSLGGSWSKLMAYQNGTWTQADASISASFWTLQNISQQLGYWLYQNSNQTLTLIGQPQPISLQLIKGWNLIGYPTLTTQSVESVLAPISGKWKKLLYFKNNQWSQADASLPTSFWTLTEMQSGKGYWLEMTSSGTLPFNNALSKSTSGSDQILLTNLNPYKTFKTKSVVSPPQFPSGYYGSVVIDGKPASIGSEVIMNLEGSTDTYIGITRENGEFGLLCIPASNKNEQETENKVIMKVKVAGAIFPIKYSSIWKSGENQKVNINLSTKPDDESNKYLTYNLLQNYPNPFNTNTQIQYSIPTDGFVKIQVYDPRGQLVNTLINGFKSKGHYTITWNGKNNQGFVLPTGIYFCRMSVTGHEIIRKLLFIR
ncbi:MAG: carboxypeptidase regulatory-like domain-containing protein [Bacteroidales bacterium]|nr:carboxypeptidase regulatory-like domain-containing protein [Bacteroidales bacterium]